MAEYRLTERQRECLDWLEQVGRASEKLARGNGFAKRTLDALVDAGLVEATPLYDEVGRWAGEVYAPKASG